MQAPRLEWDDARFAFVIRGAAGATLTIDAVQGKRLGLHDMMGREPDAIGPKGRPVGEHLAALLLGGTP